MAIFYHNGKQIEIEAGTIFYRMDYHISGVKYRVTDLPKKERCMNGIMKAIDAKNPEEAEKHDFNYTLGDIGYVIFLTPEEAKTGYLRHDSRRDPMI